MALLLDTFAKPSAVIIGSQLPHLCYRMGERAGLREMGGQSWGMHPNSWPESICLLLPVTGGGNGGEKEGEPGR